MTNRPFITAIVLAVVIPLVMCTGGCAVIAGEDIAGETPHFTLHFVETLRDQGSLLAESYRTVAPGATSATESLQRPGSVYADPFRVYVIDTYINPPGVPSARVFIFDRGARALSVLTVPTLFGSPSSGGLLAPSGIAVQANAIFVSDSQQGRVFAYDLNGLLLMVMGAHAIASPNGSGTLSSPSALALDVARNRLYVADSGAQQVRVFDSLGMYLFDIGSSGIAAEDFKFPSAVCLDREGNVYVVDSLRMRVYVYDPEGEFKRAFSLKGVVPGPSVNPAGIAVDSHGHIYVTDAVNNNVLVFAPEGKLIHTWGRTGSLLGDFWTPAGIFIDDRDYIYIADQTNGRVQTFQYVN